MPYLSGAADEKAMLDALGLQDVEDLFADVPPGVRVPLKLPPGKSELEVKREMVRMLSKNESFEKRPHFLGAGAYPHYVPAHVNPLILRGEFYTSYTPYQPEILQGMLQAMFEYQTYVTRLTEMEVSNISMYDGPTALAEAVLVSARASRGRNVLVPKNLFWEKKSVIANYVAGLGLRLVEFGYDPETGEADLADLEARVTPDTACVVLQNPNFFGVIESRAREVREILDRKAPKALFVADIGDPYSLGILRGPGAYGADVAVGEGAAIGNSVAFGGPYLGMFATRWDHVRRMPGRIVGETVDANGERAYCLTLSTREQHIRRDKATSNICSNEALNALAFSITLASLGERGFREVSRQNAHRAQTLRKRIAKLPGYHAPFTGRVFNEFVIASDAPTRTVEATLRRKGLNGGLNLRPWHRELGNAALYCVTEAHPEWALSGLVEALKLAKRPAKGVHA